MSTTAIPIDSAARKQALTEVEEKTMSVPYYHVDAFTHELFTGNPAGVCLLPAFPTERTLRDIAAENRHSETAFIVGRPDGDFDLRWFTPKVETDLCGHATLASAFVLALRGDASWPARFHTRSGILTVARDQDALELDFPIRALQPCEVPTHLLPALGLANALVMRSWRDYVVILDDPSHVLAVSPDITRLAGTTIGNTGAGAIITAPGDDPVDYVCRYFSPADGISEDPATGSIQCALAPYWANRLGRPALQVRQLSLRGGAMRCTVAGERVKIRGRARLYLAGSLEVAV